MTKRPISIGVVYSGKFMVDQKILEYIKTSSSQGKTKEEIYKKLLNQGRTVEVIQEGFNSIESVEPEKEEDTQKRTIRIIVTIAAVLVGAGIFSFIAANWQEMGRTIKVSIILISMLVSYFTGWYLKEKLNFLKTGGALILLGLIIYGAGIFLVAQMFNIRANWPDGFILWMIGTIAMAFAVESFSLFYLAILLGIRVLFGHPFIIFTGLGDDLFLLTSSFLLLGATLITFFTGWTIRKKMPPAPASQLFLLLSVFFLGLTLLAFNRDFGDPFSWRTILFLTSVAGLINAYYFKAILTLGLSLIGIVSWWGAQAAEWAQSKDIKTSAIFAGLAFIVLLFYILGHLHEKELKFKRFAPVYLVLGIISITGILFFLSTKLGLISLEEMTKGNNFFAAWQVALSLLFLVGFFIVATTYTASQKLISSFEILAVTLLSLLFVVIAILPPQAVFIKSQAYSSFFPGQELSSTGILWAVIFNLVIFFELLGLIFSGYVRREGWLINLGALFLFLLIIVKYFDWFFTFLDKSIFFIGAGILLFVVGWLMERGRRYMISNIEAKVQ